MKHRVTSEVDFISNLPHSIIEIILGGLPFQDIVRTSILSTEWRYRWLSCPEIVLDSMFGDMLLGLHKPKPVIYQVLERHQGPLFKFILQIPMLKPCPDINEWVHMLPNHNLQHFALHLPYGPKHGLTSHLFNFQNLRYLKLVSCVIMPPLGFKGFPKLVLLDLDNFSLVPVTFGDFVSSCPMVEEMRISGCPSSDCFEISGPKLKSFVFDGSIHSVSFANCPVLRNVELDICGGLFDCIKALSHLPSLEDLKLDSPAFERLVEHGAPNKLPIALNTLKKLRLFYDAFTEEISSAICFIQSCPNLQALEILNTDDYGEAAQSVADILRLQNMKTTEPLTHLKIVKMELYYGSGCEIELVKYLLASAIALEEMLIVPTADSAISRIELILNEFKQYPRASQRAEIKYKRSI